jgi:hypothetical protein
MEHKMEKIKLFSNRIRKHSCKKKRMVKRVNGEYVSIARKHLFISTRPSDEDIYQFEI